MYGMPIGDFSTFCGGFGAGQMQSFGPMINPMPNSVFNNCVGKENAFQQGREMALRMQIPGLMNSSISALNSMENSLSGLLQSDKLDEAQRAKIQTALDKIKAIKDEFQNKFKNIDVQNLHLEELMAVQEEVQNAAKGVEGIQKEVSNLATEISKSIEEKMKKEAEQAANGGGTGTDGTAVDGNADGASSGSTTKVGEGDTAVEVDNETGRPAGLGAAPSRAELASTCLKIRQSITCMGTNHNVLDPIIQGLDETNIIEIVKYWEDNYNKGNKTKESFFEKIFDDVGDDWQSTYIPIMREALAKRAEALGIGDEVEAELAIVDMELTKGPSGKKLWCGSWQDDHKLAKGLKAAYELIKNKEAANATAAKDKVTEDKTKAEKAESDAKAKEAEEKRQKYADFRNDMFQYWGITDEDAQMVNVYYENGQYRAHVNGKDYYGKSFREILAAIENAKDTDASGKEIDPKKYLIGKSE